MITSAGRIPSKKPEVRFGVHVREDNREGPPLVRLKAICGPDDDGSPCITVMLPEDDCPKPAAPHGRQPGPRTAFPSPPASGCQR
jgi:hypothetical protein